MSSNECDRTIVNSPIKPADHSSQSADLRESRGLESARAARTGQLETPLPSGFVTCGRVTTSLSSANLSGTWFKPIQGESYETPIHIRSAWRLLLVIRRVWPRGQARALSTLPPGPHCLHLSGDIWTADENGQNIKRITVHRARDVYPRFSPDGKWIAFS